MTGAPLRMVERRQLLNHLATLAAPDSGTRADAALKVAELVARKGLSWPALIPAAETGDGDDVAPPADWRADVAALLARPDLGSADRAFLAKLSGWRAPGVEGGAAVAGDWGTGGLSALKRSEHIAEWVRLTAEKSLAQDAPVKSRRSDGRGGSVGAGINAATRELGLERTEAQRAAKVARWPRNQPCHR